MSPTDETPQWVLTIWCVCLDTLGYIIDLSLCIYLFIYLLRQNKMEHWLTDGAKQHGSIKVEKIFVLHKQWPRRYHVPCTIYGI